MTSSAAFYLSAILPPPDAQPHVLSDGRVVYIRSVLMPDTTPLQALGQAPPLARSWEMLMNTHSVDRANPAHLLYLLVTPSGAFAYLDKGERDEHAAAEADAAEGWDSAFILFDLPLTDVQTAIIDAWSGPTGPTVDDEDPVPARLVNVSCASATEPCRTCGKRKRSCCGGYGGNYCNDCCPNHHGSWREEVARERKTNGGRS